MAAPDCCDAARIHLAQTAWLALVRAVALKAGTLWKLYTLLEMGSTCKVQPQAGKTVVLFSCLPTGLIEAWLLLWFVELRALGFGLPQATSQLS